MSLTRADFDQACKAYIDHHGSGGRRLSNNWAWTEHSYLPNLGYMTRSIRFPNTGKASVNSDLEGYTLNEVIEEDEETTAQVPVFYFSIHTTNGSPLSLSDILETPLLRRNALPQTGVTAYGVSEPDSPFPLLSQGDHPVLATPAWYLHPCHSSEVIAEVLAEIDQKGWTQEQRMLRWMEVWFMVLGNVVSLEGTRP